MTAAPSYADPSGSSAIVAAVNFLCDILLGTVATTVAIIAVAAVGFSMLSGRVSYRRGVTVVIGCFILFGARQIAAGIQRGDGSDAPEFQPVAAAPPPPTQQRPADYDPYAGAAVP